GSWAGGGRINSFSVAARERRIFRIANQKNRERAGGDGSFRRDVHGRKAGKGLTTRQHDPCSRSKKCFSQQGIFLEPGVVVRSFANAGEWCFGNNSFEARVDGGGFERDPGAHGFSEGKDMSGVLGGYEFIENSARVVAFEPAVGCDWAFTFTVRAHVHYRAAVAVAKKKALVFEGPHAIVRDSVEEHDPGAIWVCRANFPTAKKHPVGRSDVERFAPSWPNETSACWMRSGVRARRIGWRKAGATSQPRTMEMRGGARSKVRKIRRKSRICRR